MNTAQVSWIAASAVVVLTIYHFGVGRWSRFSPPSNSPARDDARR
jgi:hypothetical protein